MVKSWFFSSKVRNLAGLWLSSSPCQIIFSETDGFSCHFLIYKSLALSQRRLSPFLCTDVSSHSFQHNGKVGGEAIKGHLGHQNYLRDGRVSPKLSQRDLEGMMEKGWERWITGGGTEGKRFLWCGPFVSPSLDPWSNSPVLWEGMDLHWSVPQTPCPFLGCSLGWFLPPVSW